MGIYGIVVGVIATLVEGTYGIDDNITVPLATALLVFIPSINLWKWEKVKILTA